MSMQCISSQPFDALHVAWQNNAGSLLSLQLSSFFSDPLPTSSHEHGWDSPVCVTNFPFLSMQSSANTGLIDGVCVGELDVGACVGGFDAISSVV
jgi:hypothetical protein